MKRLTSRQIEAFQSSIKTYYGAPGRRDLPWRKTRNPYRIFVSEFMLQQTQVARVLEKYGPFISRFPDFESLARAPLQEVVGEWSGLGYNRRALHLREAARIVVERHGGRLPREIDDLMALPGIGRATACEIAAFAYGDAHPFIETNIRAVFIHFFFAGRTRVTDAEIMRLVEQTLDRGAPRVWFYALMDCGVMLKRKGPNPSRRSAHHAKQSKFEGSDRQARGLVVRALAARPLGERDLARETGLAAARVRSILPGLARDGLIVRDGKRFRIA